MTRINLVNPSELSDQHLLAEIRELPRIFTLVEKNPNTNNIPTNYKMGTGHMNFFKDKLKFLYWRYIELYTEWHKRGFKYKYTLNQTLANMLDVVKKYPDLNNNWSPDEKEKIISIQRLQEKIEIKPEFYKWTKY